MTWIKVSDTALDDPRVLTLSRGDRLLHLEGLAYSARHGTDGLVPRGALARMTDEPDPEAAAARLVEAGLWDVDVVGWRVVWLQGDQIGAEEHDRYRDLQAGRQRRRRRHLRGDHAECSPRYCRAAVRPRHVTGHVTVTRESRQPVPSRPSLTDEGVEDGLTADGTGDGPGVARPEDWGPDEPWRGDPWAEGTPVDLVQCGRCRGEYDEGQVAEVAGPEYLCLACYALVHDPQRGPGCVAFTKAGGECGNRALGDPDERTPMWCRYHERSASRGSMPERMQERHLARVHDLAGGGRL